MSCVAFRAVPGSLGTSPPSPCPSAAFRQRGGKPLRRATGGAQRAFSRYRQPYQPTASRFARTIGIAVLTSLVALGAHALGHSQTARADTPPAAGQKAVIIVGPASGNTSEYLKQAEVLAKQAEAEGMTVNRVFTPRATWRRVLAVIQDANLVVYFGHGNGWPSPYSPFQEDTKDGFGLNPESGAGTSSPTQYYGANKIRAKVRLAPHAVVLLYRLCYASGNAESGMRPMDPRKASDRSIARQRVENFASGFLTVGA